MREVIFMIGMILAVLLPGNALAQATETDFASTQDRIWAEQQIETEGGMARFDCKQLRILRNTVYAKYGFDFQSNWVSRQFDSDPRYLRVPGTDSEKVAALVSDADLDLVDAFKQAEETNQCSEYWADFRDFAVVEGYYDGGECGCFLVWARITIDPATAFLETYCNGKLEPEWLEPFTCEELSFLEASVYARHGYAFTSEDLREVFEGLMNNLDKLNLLRIRRIAREQSCTLTDYEW